LGTLRADRCEQFEVDVNVASESTISLKVVGPGTVHFVGYYHRLPEMSEDFDSYSGDEFPSGSYSDDDEESDDERAALDRRIAAYMRGDESSGEDYENDRVEEVVTSESDSDIDVEESMSSYFFY
jgi:hypothetical protein